MEGVRSTNAIWLLLAATLFLRALVPAGWMPDTASGGDVIVAKMCNSSMVVTIPLGRDLSLIHIRRCRRSTLARPSWSPLAHNNTQ